MKEKPAQANDATASRGREGGDDLLLAGEDWAEKESGRFQARLSNLPHYAVTGVKAQAFVLVLF